MACHRAEARSTNRRHCVHQQENPCDRASLPIGGNVPLLSVLRSDIDLGTALRGFVRAISALLRRLRGFVRAFRAARPSVGSFARFSGVETDRGGFVRAILSSPAWAIICHPGRFGFVRTIRKPPNEPHRPGDRAGTTLLDNVCHHARLHIHVVGGLPSNIETPHTSPAHIQGSVCRLRLDRPVGSNNRIAKDDLWRDSSRMEYATSFCKSKSCQFFLEVSPIDLSSGGSNAKSRFMFASVHWWNAKAGFPAGCERPGREVLTQMVRWSRRGEAKRMAPSRKGGQAAPPRDATTGGSADRGGHPPWRNRSADRTGGRPTTGGGDVVARGGLKQR